MRLGLLYYSHCFTQSQWDNQNSTILMFISLIRSKSCLLVFDVPFSQLLVSTYELIHEQSHWSHLTSTTNLHDDQHITAISHPNTVCNEHLFLKFA